MTQFAVGAAVRTTTSHARVPKGTVGTVTTSGLAIPGEITVEFEGISSKHFYQPYELELLSKVRRRLTITPTDATTAARYDDDPVGPDYISADEVIIEGDFEFEVEEIDPTVYVQVKVSGYSRLTYIDPSDQLGVGDRVLVPLGYRDTETAGVVIDVGRGDYDGPCKTVIARLAVEAL